VIVFILLAALGLLLSVGIHVLTFFGVDPQDAFPYFWLLHIGIFVVFIPGAMLQPRSRRKNPTDRRKSAGDLIKHAPRWFARAVPYVVGYCVINFLVFIGHMSSGSPQTDGKGGYELREHGRLVRTITATEYHSYRAWEVRGMSGHWIIFYGIALGLLWSAYRERRESVEAATAAAMLRPRSPNLAAAMPKHATPRMLNYGRTLPGWAMPIWLHASLGMMLLMVGWIGGPALMGLLVLPHMRTGTNANNGGLVCPMIILLVGSALCGALVPRMLLRRLVPSRCPSCGGRAYFAGNQPMRYRCRDCGGELDVRA
jgi:hypothetical protein